MHEIRMVRRGCTLVPAGLSEQEAMDSIPIGVPLRARITRTRSSRHHRWFFALINLVHGSMPENSYIKTADDLRKAILVAIGEFDMKSRRTPDGRWIKVAEARSMRWDKMDQAEFQRVSDRVLGFVCEAIIPGLDRADLVREITNHIGE